MQLNHWITIAALVIILLLFAYPKQFESFDFRKSRSTAWAAILWALWCVTLLPIYHIGKLPYSWALIITDVGSACQLAAALVLLKGDADAPTMVRPFVITICLLLTWDYVIGEFAAGPGQLILSIFSVAPSLLMAQIGVLLVGWVFVARWGSYAIPFLVLTFIYAVMQFPAYITLNLSTEFHFGSPEKEQLDKLVNALAILKIPLMYGFLGFLVSSPRPDFRRSQYWPQQAIPPNKKIFIPVYTLLLFVGGKAVGEVVQTVMKSVLP